MNKKVLVVDDEEPIRKLLKGRFEREGFEVSTCDNTEAAEKELSSQSSYSVVVTDLKMPGKDGFSLMDVVKKNKLQTRIILVTGFGEKEVAIKALKSGASDYMEKPFDLDELTHSVKRCNKEFNLENENEDLLSRLEARADRAEKKVSTDFWYDSVSSSMEKTKEWLKVLKNEAVRSNAEEPTVLILGESGTGKEGVARKIHSDSRRGNGPWIAVNCANFNEQLLESELFGHERGAFTGAAQQKRGLFEIAKGGTLFLDEIGEIDPKLQARLLRVLQEKSFRRVGGTSDIPTDVRVVAATNQNLKNKVQSGQFRDDLYHRIARVIVELPNLRTRQEDLIPMARVFADRAFSSRGKKFVGFTGDAEEAIQGYTWPGNVREMLNIIERCALVSTGGHAVSATALSLPNAPIRMNLPKPKLEVITSELESGGGASIASPDGNPNGTVTGEITYTYTDLKKRWVASFEKEYLITLLKKHTGNVSSAAREAKLDRSNFLRLLRKHGVTAGVFRSKEQAA